MFSSGPSLTLSHATREHTPLVVLTARQAILHFWRRMFHALARTQQLRLAVTPTLHCTISLRYTKTLAACVL